MNGVNMQASVYNLSQMDRVQQNQHNNPIVNQEQNAESTKEDAARRIDMPVQPDQVENKTVNPDGRRARYFQKGKKREKEKNKNRNKRGEGNYGRFVDFSA